MGEHISRYYLFVLFALALRSVSGGCENDVLGLADRYILDNQLTASSEIAQAKNGRLNFTAGPSWCASTSDTTPYLQVDLQAPHVICAVSTQGNSKGPQWVERYTLQSSSDGRTWANYTENGQVKVFLGNFDSRTTAKRVLFSAIVARYLRVVARGYHGRVCIRAELYGVAQFSGNIALFKPTLQSSTISPYISSNAVDGGKSTRVSKCTHTNEEPSPWWRVDLGQVEPVAEVNLLNRDTNAGSRLNGAEIRVGNETTNGGATNQLCKDRIRVPQGQEKKFACNSKIYGRYVFIRIPGNNKVLTLCEVEVYSFKRDGNLAFGQPTVQNSTAHGGASSRAVDGNLNTDWDGQSCTHTNLQKDPWWRVDLGSSFPVAEVVIVNRDCNGDCGERLKAFEIRIGDNDQRGGATNPSCGGIHGLSAGKTKSFYCLPRLVGRYVTIRVNGLNKLVTLCEVQVYSTRQKACSSSPVGLVDSSKIPDNWFTASSNGNNKVPSLARLKGGKAWLPRTSNDDEFLQIHLGSVYSVCGVATQGAPGANEWTKTYKIMTSLDNANWTTYAENNAVKIFNGNSDRSSIVRNDLYHPPLAKFLRLYPLQYQAYKALRVEVYGSSQGCHSSLSIQDNQLSASSESDVTHAAHWSDLYGNSSWCSASAKSSEYLQIDLGQTKAITGVATQGDPASDKWITSYKLQFGISHTRWFRQLRLEGNEGRDKTYVNWFSQPIEARIVRIVPLAWKRSVCLRIDFLGCGDLLNVPKLSIHTIQDVNLPASKTSFVELTCNVSTRPNVSLSAAILWILDGLDITSLSPGTFTQGKFLLSTLRVNFTTAGDIASTSNCTKQSESSRIVHCEKRIMCLSYYPTLGLRLEPVYETATVNIQLRVPAAVRKITVDTILGKSAVVRWERLPSGGIDEDQIHVYEIWYAKESNINTKKSFNASANDSSSVLDDLTENTRYEIKVRAISAVGKGRWTLPVFFKTARTVNCEEKILGVKTGLYPDMTASSSQFNSSTSASYSFMSYLEDFAWCASLSDTSPYLEINLIDKHVICALSTRGDPNGKNWVETYMLQSSLDGTTWRDYKEGGRQRVFLGNYDSTSIVKVELYSGIVARKVRLQVKTSHGLACLKIQLFGVKLLPVPIRKNLALGQPTAQVSTDHGGDSSRAVDGDLNKDWSGGSCTHTNFANNSWWRVDLGSSFPVAEVVIVNRACSGACADVLKKFEISIGNSTTAADPLNLSCGKNLNIPSGETMTFRCVPILRGKYIYIIRTGINKVLTLCEVEVYSTLKSNIAFGKNSSQSSTDHGGSASRAVDGLSSNDFGKLSCTHTRQQDTPWWKVDFGSSVTVGEVVITNRACPGSCGKRLRGFEIRIGNVDESNGGTSNTRCGIPHSLESGETKSIYCVPRLVGRYLYIRINDSQRVLTLCEVEVFSRRSSNNVCANKPVGVSDEFITPDHRFSASTYKAGHDPSEGRLSGSSAWIPSTNTNSSDYLEIDLGSVFFICGVVTQGNPNKDEWTKSYKILTSLSNVNWTSYEERGVEKIFPGNNDRNTERRNNLMTSHLAKFIRFYPVSYHTSKALRVEVYGYAQGSRTPLGLENGDLLDAQLEASSNSAASVNGRLYNTSSWCTSTVSPPQYIQIDLENVKTVAGVATQGDYSSDKWVKTYEVWYSYEGVRWNSSEQILDGNNDRNSVKANWMPFPFVARYLRIYAKTWNTGICLRVDGYGSTLVNAPIIRPALVDTMLPKQLGSSVTVTCVAYGIPHVSVTWKTNGQELTNSSDVTTSAVLTSDWEETVSNLTVTYRSAAYAKELFQCRRVFWESRVLRCQKLEVTCDAMYFGTLLQFESSAFVSLANNLFLPEPPSYIVLSNITSTSVVLSWHKTDAGDAPIMFYRVLYNTSIDSNPVTMNETTTMRNISITMLKPNTDYTFNVQAVSAIGDGPVSNRTYLKTYLPVKLFIPSPHVRRLYLNQRNVSLVCFGQGYPLPTIEWKKNGNITKYPVIKKDLSEINSSRRLEIRSEGVTYNEAGNYTCEVYNGVDGMSTVTSTVELIFIPEFTTTPEARTVLEGESVTFHCKATGMPTPKISWSYSGSAGGLPPNSRQLSNGSLVIYAVQNTPYYEGSYRCNATSRAGVSVAEASLTVWSYPKITSTSRTSVAILLGKSMNLTCVVVGDPQPVVVWTKYGSKSIPGAVVENGNSSLLISQVSITDEGIYQCLGKSPAGVTSINFTVVVLEPAKIGVAAPHVLKLVRGVENVSVECFGRGKPLPTITWKKNGTNVLKTPSQLRNDVVQVVGNSSDLWNVSSVLFLRLDGATYSDAGNYTCEVYNGVDTNDTVESTISVLFKPEFVEEPRNKTIVLEGDNVTLPCHVTGVPTPSIVWRYNGGKLPPSQQDQSGSLLIYSVRNNETNEGMYTCEAASVAGVLTSNVTLIVDAPPWFISPLKNTSFIMGTTLNLTCDVTADPMATINWLKDDSEKITGAIFLQRNATLIMNNVKLSDEGWYKCMVWNRAGNATSRAYIEITVPPGVSLSREFLKLQKDERNTTVDCYGSGKPLPIVMWKKGQENISFVPAVTINDAISVVQILLKTNATPWNITSRLYLRSGGVTYQEAGNYTCEVSNGVGHTGVVSATTEVLFVPEFVKEPSDQIIVEDSNATFVCNATGVPSPSIVWTFNKGPMPPSSGNNAEALTVFRVKNNVSYEGNYTCTAVNRAGMKKTTAHLTVDVPATVLSISQNVSVVDGSILNLTCLPFGDPSPSIDWVKNGMLVMRNAELYEGNRTLIIRNVAVEDEGLFTCVAVNRAGNDTSGVYVEVRARSRVSISPKKELNLLKYDKNITVDCHGFGKPTPNVTWTHNGRTIVRVSSANADRNKVVQTVVKSTAKSPWNITSRLYLRTGGITYEDAGKYTCEVFNGVGGNASALESLQVLFIPEFVLKPKSEIAVQGSNATFYCNASGVPEPVVRWSFSKGHLPRNIATNFSITLLSVKNTDQYEGSYTCNASSRAGYNTEMVNLTVDVPPKVQTSEKIITLVKNEKNVTFDCYGHGKPLPLVTWMKGEKKIPHVSVVTKNNSNQVVQRTFDMIEGRWNVTSRLYLKIGGVTYREAGNYTCKVSNGVGEEGAVNTSTEVLFLPEFLRKPADQIITESSNVTFTCNVTGVPTPSITWTFNGGPLPPSSQAKGSTLVVPLVKNNRSYEGNYSCIASSRAGVSTATAKLTVDVPPVITRGLNESVVAERGDTVTLSCSARGDPSPRFHWTKDGSSFIPRATYEDLNKTLRLSNVDSSDDGVYICWAINDAGRKFTSSNLSVHAIPSLRTTFANITTTIENNNWTLSCTGESIPAPEVVWFKDDKEVTTNQHTIITTSGYFKRATFLEIPEVKYDDRGVYTCSFRNYRGGVNATGRLIVHVPLNILNPPASVKERLGLNVTFNCTVRGFPLPSLMWLRDRVTLTGSEEEKINEQKDEDNILVHTSLTIFKAKRADTGLYICKANNTMERVLTSANLTVLEKPDILNVSTLSVASRTVSLSWKVTFDGNLPLLFYIVTHNISNGTVSYNVSSTKSSYNVLYLNPVSFYKFIVTATNQLGTSDPAVVPITTLEAEPGPPQSLKATVISSRSIYVNWTIPSVTNGKLVKYVVYYDRTDAYVDNSRRPVNQTLLSNVTWLVIKQLVPYTKYSMQVQAFTKVGGGNYSVLVGPVWTHEDVPDKPGGVTYEYKKASEVYLIKWSSPLEPNGNIKGYKIFLVLLRDNSGYSKNAKDRVFEIEGSSTQKSISLQELNGVKSYDIIVQARTKMGFGKNSTEKVNFSTPVLSPPPPPSPPPPNETTTTTAVIVLPEFSDINGPIIYYQIIVLRVPQDYQGSIPKPEGIPPGDIVPYEDAQKSSEPKAYIAFAFEANEFQTYQWFTLGKGQRSINRKRREIEKNFFNGPLEDNTKYNAFVRAFTKESRYSQSAYIKIETKALYRSALPSAPKPSDDFSTAIIAVVVTVFITVVIAAAGFIYLRRKRRLNRYREGEKHELHEFPTGTAVASTEGSINRGYMLDIDANRSPISTHKLKDFYLLMHADGNRLFTEEYKSISISGSPTTEICDRQENKSRNRYGNIKAYDHSRVILTMESSSDYINANYIDGFVRPKQYIATIGPKPETVDHFWWMIWQENVSFIVMLTRPVENGKTKCHQYWPDNGSEEHGCVTVSVLETRVFSEFEIRTLSVQMPARPDLKPRAVTHFFFTAWPDHDVPGDAIGLLQFWRAVRKTSTDDSPMVVHCSAGVGRTGTFICIDAMMEQINASEELDVYNFVTRMREQRNFMVQKESQYVFIFYALLEATAIGITEINSHDLRIKIQKMAKKDPTNHKSSFQREFELLDGVVHQENMKFTSALKRENAKKNRYSNVLPLEKSRVILEKTTEEEGDDTSYINANYLEGFQQKKAYIATQAPLDNTVGDFWRMVWQEKVHCIVMLITLKEDSEPPFVDYWSEKESISHGLLSVETTDFVNKETYFVRKINLSDTKTAEVRKVTHYTFVNWPKDCVPDDAMTVINFISILQETQQKTGNHPIVVHCSDGIGRTGTLCALMTSLERVKLEDTVDVFTTVRMLRTQRPGMIQTLKQYRFVYDAVLAYMDSFEASLYQNFL